MVSYALFFASGAGMIAFSQGNPVLLVSGLLLMVGVTFLGFM